jgi:hypothetical protein
MDAAMVLCRFWADFAGVHRLWCSFCPCLALLCGAYLLHFLLYLFCLHVA